MAIANEIHDWHMQTAERDPVRACTSEEEFWHSSICVMQ
jgi:hypothetical protein